MLDHKTLIYGKCYFKRNFAYILIWTTAIKINYATYLQDVGVRCLYKEIVSDEKSTIKCEELK